MFKACLTFGRIAAVMVQLGCCIKSPSIDIVIKEGGKYCAVVQIPEAWRLPSYCDSVPNPRVGCSVHMSDMVFRRTKESRDTILVGLKLDEFSGPGGKNSFSENGFRMGLMAHGKAVPISLQEWKQAENVELFRGEVEYQQYLQGPPFNNQVRDPAPDSRLFVYAGKPLRKSGDFWAHPRFSPDNTYIALQSYNNARFMSKDGEGSFYIDIYNTKTGGRISFIEAHRCAYAPDFVFGSTGWLSSRDFAVPYDWQKRELILCHFDP
jgi:hypothetical protein